MGCSCLGLIKHVDSGAVRACCISGDVYAGCAPPENAFLEVSGANAQGDVIVLFRTNAGVGSDVDDTTRRVRYSGVSDVSYGAIADWTNEFKYIDVFYNKATKAISKIAAGAHSAYVWYIDDTMGSYEDLDGVGMYEPETPYETGGLEVPLGVCALEGYNKVVGLRFYGKSTVEYRGVITTVRKITASISSAWWAYRYTPGVHYPMRGCSVDGVTGGPISPSWTTSQGYGVLIEPDPGDGAYMRLRLCYAPRAAGGGGYQVTPGSSYVIGGFYNSRNDHWYWYERSDEGLTGTYDWMAIGDDIKGSFVYDVCDLDLVREKVGW